MTSPQRPSAPKRPRKRAGIGVPSGAVPTQNARRQRDTRAATPPTTLPKPDPNPVRVRKAPTSQAGRKTGVQNAENTKSPKKRWSLGGLSVSVRLLSTFVIFGMVALNLVPVGMQWYQQEQEYRAVQAELAAAEARNQELQDSIDTWGNDNFVASQAKKRLGFVWPGEVQYNVVGLPESAQSGDEPTDTKAQGTLKPWPSTILQSMIDADSPAASSGLAGLVPNVDPNETVSDEETGE